MGLWRCPHCAVNLGSAGSHLSSGKCTKSPRPTQTPAPAPPPVLLEPSTLTTAYDATSAAIKAHITWAMIRDPSVSTTQYVPSSVHFKTSYAAFLAHCAAQATDNDTDTDDTAWRTVFALGKLMYGRVPGQPNTTRAETRARLDLIVAGRVTENEVFVYWVSGMAGTGSNQRPVPDKVKRAEALVRAGELRKAMQVLTNVLTLPTDLDPEKTAELLVELKGLHPQGTFEPEPPESGPQAAARAPVPTPAHQQGEATPPPGPVAASTEADVIKAVMGSAKLTAPGLSGWRAEHLQAAFGLKVGNVSGPIARMIQHVAAGKVPEGFDRDTAYGGLLTPLLKPNGKLRPIVVGDLFVRMGGRAIAAHYATKFAAFFNPKHQLGIATSAGAEAIIHAVRIALAANPSFVALQLDFTNAYNTVDRALIESELKAHFPALLPYFYARYGTRTKLFVPSLGTDAWVWSECGVHQGDPLGPFFFALALNVILRDVVGTGSGDAMDTDDLLPLILAYLDDIVIVGSIEAVAKLAAKLALCTVALRSGLVLNPSKCASWSPTITPEERRAALVAACEAARVSPAQLDPTLIGQPLCETGGSILLGAPIGSDHFCKVTLEAATAATRVAMGRLLELPSPQAQLLCLRYCASPRATATLRASPPTITKDYAVQHDNAVTDTLEVIQAFAVANNDIKTLTHLPITYGGVGLPSAVETAPLAYAASVADAARVAAAISQVFAPAASAIAACLATPQELWPQGVSTDLHVYLNTFTKSIIEYRANHPNFAVSVVDDVKALPKIPAQLPTTQPHLQRRLAHLAATMTEARFRQSLSPAAKAMFLSNQGYGAAAPLFAIPSCDLFTMDAATIRHYLHNRLLIAILTGTVNQCDSIHLFPEHCPKGDGPTIVHDITCKAVSNCLQAMGAVVTEQFKPDQVPSDRVHDQQPDLIVTNFPAPNARALVEFGITSPTTQDTIGAAQFTPLTAARRYEGIKVTKYSQLAREENACVVPAIMETSGAMGAGLQGILDKGNEIVSPAWYDSTEDVRTFTTRTFKQFHTQAIAVAFWGGSLQKLKAHDAAHRAEQVPSATALLRDMGLVEPWGSHTATPPAGHRNSGRQRHSGATRYGRGGHQSATSSQF